MSNITPFPTKVLHCVSCNNADFYYTEHDEFLCQKCGFANTL